MVLMVLSRIQPAVSLLLAGCLFATSLVALPLTVFAESQPLQGSVIQTDTHASPSINPDDVKEVEAGTAIEMVVTTPLSTSSVVQGDEFFAKISRNYEVDGKVVIPKGTLIHGVVDQAKGPRRAGLNAFVSTKFDYMITPDGREIPIEGNFSNKDGALKSTAKVVGRTTGYGLVGGVAGALVATKMFGLGAAIASEGWIPIGGAALGGTVGMGAALLKKGQHQMIQPGVGLKFKLTEPISLPTMNMPAENATDFAPEGLDVKVLGMQIGKDPFGEMTELTLALDMTNQTEYAFSFFEIALVDENGTQFFASPFGDTGMWFKKLTPNTKMTGNLSFTVDNPKLQHTLVFYKQYTREPVAQFTLMDNMVADKKVTKRRVKSAEQQQYTYKRSEEF